MQNVMDFSTENTNLSEASRGGGSLRPKTLDQNTSIIVKIFPDLHNKEPDGKTFKRYFFYQKLPFISPRGDAFSWTRPSLQVTGVKDPQVEEFFRRVTELKSAGLDSKSDEYKRRKTANDAIKPKDRVILALHVLGSSTVEAWDFPFQVAEKIFGAASTSTRDAIEGVATRYAKFGVNIFDPKSEVNWVKITSFRDTNGMTNYSVEPATTEQMDQSTGQIMRVGIKQPASGALASMTLERFPKLEDYAKSDLWTLEEIQAYVDSNFRTLPQRLFERAGKGGQERQGRLSQEAPTQNGYTAPSVPAAPAPQAWSQPSPQQYAPQAPQYAPQAPQYAPQAPQYAPQPQQAPQYSQPAAPSWPAAVPAPQQSAADDAATLRSLFEGT